MTLKVWVSHDRSLLTLWWSKDILLYLAVLSVFRLSCFYVVSRWNLFRKVHVLKVSKPALQILSMKVVFKPVLEVFLLQWQTVLVYQLFYTHTQQTCNDSNAITLLSRWPALKRNNSKASIHILEFSQIGSLEKKHK